MNIPQNLKTLIYITVIIIAALLFNSCSTQFVFLSPNLIRCSKIDFSIRQRMRLQGVMLGMSKDDFIQKFENATSPKMTLSDTNRDTIYVYYKSCPLWRYTFKHNMLIDGGYLVMEMGFWHYIETDDFEPYPEAF